MENIEKIYEKILPKLKILEPERIKLKNSLVFVRFQIFILSFLFIILTCSVFNSNNSYIAAFCFLGVLITMVLLYMKGITYINKSKEIINSFKKLVKDNCMDDLAKEFSITWDKEKPLDQSPLERSGRNAAR